MSAMLNISTSKYIPECVAKLYNFMLKLALKFTLRQWILQNESFQYECNKYTTNKPLQHNLLVLSIYCQQCIFNNVSDIILAR